MPVGSDDIQVLRSVQAVRRRAGMYLSGPVEDPATLVCLATQGLCIGLDQLEAGTATTVTLAVDADRRGFVIRDDASSFLGAPDRSGQPAIVGLLTELHACRLARVSTLVGEGFCSVGMAVLQALSSRCEVVLHGEGGEHRQSYRDGEPEAPLTRHGDSAAHGTSLCFRIDPARFPAPLDVALLAARVDEVRRDLHAGRIELIV
jgi:DNA gyrase subunit B